MNSSYTGFILRSYRSLLRNDIDKLFESRSYNANSSVHYKDAFNALFFNVGFNYKHSWKNLLYGYSYQDIMSVKTVIDQPTQADSYGVKLSASKGFNFLSTTLRTFGNYNSGNSQQINCIASVCFKKLYSCATPSFLQVYKPPQNCQHCCLPF